MKKRLFIVIAILAFVHCISFAQNPLDNFNYQIYYQTTSTDTLVFDSLCTRVCKVTVDDVSILNFIKVKIGTQEGIGDILQYNFAFDVTTGLPTGLSFYREQNVIYLGLHETYQADTYYYEVQIEDNLGNISSPKLWN